MTSRGTDCVALFGSNYTSMARVQPVLLAICPVVCYAAVLVPLVPASLRLVPLAGGLAVAIGAQFGRDRGRGLESRLFADWGGAPTTQRLRFAGARSARIVARRHRQLQQLIGSDFELPSEADEVADPEDGDRLYADAVGVLRALTRDSAQYPMIAAENANYGFRRNLLGLRPIGLWLAALTGIASLLGAYFEYLLAGWQHSLLFTLPVAVAGASLVGFKRVTRDWVKTAAFAYADSLLESLEFLEYQDFASRGHGGNK